MEIFIRRSVFVMLMVLQVWNIQTYCKAYFAPIDNLTVLLIDRIVDEKKSIYGAMYMLTDKKIAQALIDAKKRGVDVQLIVDQISMCSCGKGKILQEAGVPVFVHRTQDFNPYSMPLMHHKFFVFGCNQDKQPLLWTGSWNCTVRGTQHNDENVIILDDLRVVEQYLDMFTQLKKRLV